MTAVPGAVDYRCPACGGELARTPEGLQCPRGHSYVVRGGIARFVKGQAHAESFGVQWTRWARNQIDSFNGTSITRDRLRRYFGAPESLAGEVVLDAGCGAGAFLDAVAPHALHVEAIDLSTGVEAAHSAFGDLPNVRIAQADVARPPFGPESFDTVLAIGVLPFTPDPAETFRALARVVRPGGRLGVWTYERSRLEALRPRRMLRRATTRLDRERAVRFAESYAPRALALRKRLRRLPGGAKAAKFVPVADLYAWPDSPTEHLSEAAIREWTILDTHDQLMSPFEHHHTESAVRGWFAACGFEPPRRMDSEGLALVGRKAPAAPEADGASAPTGCGDFERP